MLETPPFMCKLKVGGYVLVQATGFAHVKDKQKAKSIA